MNPIYKKAIGIDVCKGSISIVRLERTGNKTILASSKKMPIGKEILCGSSSEDFKSLADTLGKMKLTTRLEHCDAGLSLCSWPELLQILKLPDSSPHVMVKFIQEEIRQYAVLPLKNIQTDYCVLRGGDSAHKNVLVGASQAESLTTVAKELEKTHVDVRLIEPAIVSLIRACYNKIIKPAGQKNIMFVLIRDEHISLSVFNGQRFDFLRTKKFESDICGSPAEIEAVIEQVESVLQFYELEKISEQKDWEVYLTCCPEASKANGIVEQLKSRINRKNVGIAAIEAKHINVIVPEGTSSDFSAVAAGAAMKLLDCNDSDISINLLTDEITEIRKSYNQLLIIMNVAAVILVLLFLHIANLSKKATFVKTKIYAKNQSEVIANIPQLTRTQIDINDQTQQTISNIGALENAFADKTWYNWAYILAELTTQAPPTVQIRNLQSRSSSTVIIEGMAINYAAVNNFINRLTKCKTISSAQLEDTRQNTQYGNGVIDYSITCSLTAQKAKEN